jgi:hypothetical protein
LTRVHRAIDYGAGGNQVSWHGINLTLTQRRFYCNVGAKFKFNIVQKDFYEKTSVYRLDS